jgi:hypothetical protein
VYVRSDGTRAILKSITSKQLEGVTDEMPQQVHERLQIALRHDNVFVNGNGYTHTGGYDINWIPFLDYPWAAADFKVFDNTFNAVAQSCEEVTEYIEHFAEDDFINTPFNQGDVGAIIDVVANDRYCCAAPVISIVSSNATYVTNVVVAGTVITFDISATAPAANNIPVITYRLTCGTNVDDATISISVLAAGNPGCPPPVNLVVHPKIGLIEAFADWIPAVGITAQFIDIADLATNISVLDHLLGDTTSSFTLPAFLLLDHPYRITLNSICGIGQAATTSPLVIVDFTLPQNG